MSLKPFFTYYGGKWRAAPRYPKPKHDTIVEPFAGAAGYALRYANRNIVLVEKNAQIAALWRYLIKTPADSIRRLPLIRLDGSQTVSDLDVEPEARSLIGFWLNKGSAAPRNMPSAWMRAGTHITSFWGEAIRERVASQSDFIRHWTVIEGDYSDAPDVTATWFVDPPYQKAGRLYVHSSGQIEYFDLALWCYQRRGQVIVCENTGADWLPFQPYLKIKSTEGSRGKGISEEAIWLADNA